MTEVRVLPARALETSAERPWPVRLLSSKILQYVDRMPWVWVEGQVVGLNRRAGTVYLTLRDPDADMSLPVSLPSRVLAGMEGPVDDGARVVIHAKPSFWPKRGTLQLQADDLRPVGVGALLARIEHLKRVLTAEGLFAPERKSRLPFLPRAVGLICGRDSKAEHDVVVNARARWPAVRFVIREVPVQGFGAVEGVCEALQDLAAAPDVDVIVIARGGGSVEDLLPFSNEALVRTAAACRTPLVSAIGHETDTPLLDLVADYRASTPTDAAKHIVPDVALEAASLRQARARSRTAIGNLLAREEAALRALRSRPALRDPTTIVTTREHDLHLLRDAARAALASLVSTATGETERLVAQVRALSPAATLERGYAVVQRQDGVVVRDPSDVAAGDPLRIRLARGELVATASPRPPSAEDRSEEPAQ